jgi:hypothetical protein
MSTGTVSAPVMSLTHAWSLSAEATLRFLRARRETAATSSRATSDMHWPSSHASDQNKIEEPSPNCRRVKAWHENMVNSVHFFVCASIAEQLRITAYQLLFCDAYWKLNLL